MPNRPASSTNPWRGILTIYAILALAVFAFPGGMVDWLDEHNQSGGLTVPLALARGIDAASSAVGVKAVGVALRKRFAAIVGEGDG
jgi:hypothetical protein